MPSSSDETHLKEVSEFSVLTQFDNQSKYLEFLPLVFNVCLVLLFLQAQSVNQSLFVPHNIMVNIHK